MSRSLIQDLNDPNLFIKHKRGDYQYNENDTNSKSAYGSLRLWEEPKRSNKAQITAGGDARRQKGHNWGADDGGHLIGARFGGSPYEENLTAQNSNLNRQDYKRLENKWASHLENGEGYNVFVNIETFGEDRPDAYMGYAIYEYPDGTRTCETFSYSNESRKEHEKWDDDLNDYEGKDQKDQVKDDPYEESNSMNEGVNYNGEYADDYGEDSEVTEGINTVIDNDPSSENEHLENDEKEEHADDLAAGASADEPASEESTEQEEASDLPAGASSDESVAEENTEQEEEASDLTADASADEPAAEESAEQEEKVSDLTTGEGTDESASEENAEQEEEASDLTDEKSTNESDSEENNSEENQSLAY